VSAIVDVTWSAQGRFWPEEYKIDFGVPPGAGGPIVVWITAEQAVQLFNALSDAIVEAEKAGMALPEAKGEP
jgi:hypothetical protein